MKKIKILYFMDGIGNAGGIQEMVINWVKNFPQNRIQVDILSYDTGKCDNYTERFEKYGGKVYIIPTFTRKGMLLKSLKETKKFFDEHNDYQIIHAHASSKAYFVLREAKKHGIKHRILHSHATQFVNRSFKSLFIGYLLKPLTISLSTDFYACSHEAGNFLFGKKRMDKKGVFIPNGIDLNKFNFDKKIRALKRKELKIDDNTIVIGNVGRFRPQKNHKFLIDVFCNICKHRSDVILVLLGNGELFDEVIDYSKKLNVYDKIKFLGYRSDVNDIVQTFDVLVMTSLFEGLPVTAVEAEAIGLPCVFADTITKDAKIIDSVSYVSLDDDMDVWYKTVIDSVSKGFENNSKQIMVEKKFDMIESSKYLVELYDKMLKM